MPQIPSIVEVPKYRTTQKYKEKTKSNLSQEEAANSSFESKASVVFRRSNEHGETVFKEYFPATKKPKVTRKSPHKHRNSEDVRDAPRRLRLLKSLTALYKAKASVLWPSELRVNLLRVAANLIICVNPGKSWEENFRICRAWALNSVPEAIYDEVLDAYRCAYDMPSHFPSPRQVGRAIGLDLATWMRAGRPWAVHPVDVSEAEIGEIQKAAKREKDKQRARERRAKRGATPREHSVAATARRLGTTPARIRSVQKSGGKSKKITVRSFCNMNGLAERSYRRHKKRGDLIEWLQSKGISLPWPLS